MENKQTGKVYLVGAGCGAAELITVKGLRCIQHCDVIVYDDLIDPELLAAAKPGAEIRYMGKRSGAHSAPQEEINRCLVELALEGKTVCRLKGGDPFVFGRGGEEILALQERGIAFEEVPGISSAIAIPAGAGIPVTHRGLSRSFHVITAHTAGTADGLPEDMEKYAALSGTLVFLMGLSRVEDICRRLIAGGKAPETPAAVVSGGNSTNPATVRASLAQLPEAVRAAEVKAPAIIVVGAVAALTLAEEQRLPLQGKCIGLTGTDRMCERLSSRLSALGARSLRLERSELQELHPKLEKDLLPGSWIVLTSGNGVGQFFRVLNENGLDIRALSACRFAVIGAATREELRKYGIQADFCPEEYNGKALAEGLLERVEAGQRIFLLRSARGSAELYQSLREKCPTEDLATYDVRPVPLKLPGGEKPDAICFSSAGGVQLYYETMGNVAPGIPCVCIGEPTAAELRRRGVTDIFIAPEVSAEGMVQKLLELLGE